MPPIPSCEVPTLTHISLQKRNSFIPEFPSIIHRSPTDSDTNIVSSNSSQNRDFASDSVMVAVCNNSLGSRKQEVHNNVSLDPSITQSHFLKVKKCNSCDKIGDRGHIRNETRSIRRTLSTEGLLQKIYSTSPMMVDIGALSLNEESNQALKYIGLESKRRIKRTRETMARLRIPQVACLPKLEQRVNTC